MVGFLRETPGWQVSVIAGHNVRGDIDAIVLPDVADLLLQHEFLNADVIIYHFGIYYPIFDAILVGNGRAKQAVVFHNITPVELGPPSARKTLEKSFAQLGNVHAADALWPVSRENAEVLLEQGVDAGKMSIEPLAVDSPPRRGIRKPRGDVIEVIFVGRIVPSKGLQDLIEALALLDSRGPRIRLRVIGNLKGAEPAFRERLLARIEELNLGTMIEFLGMVSDDERDGLLGESHVLAMPSYHEGFCVPVIEALRAGMVPVVYAAHNLRYVADGLCVSSPPGDIPAFAASWQTAIEDVDAVSRQPDTATLRLERGRLGVEEFEQGVAAHVKQFEPAVRARALRERVRELVGAPAKLPDIGIGNGN
jgi:glycosyltransferase involved in cell wall biosynthesis